MERTVGTIAPGMPAGPEARKRVDDLLQQLTRKAMQPESIRDWRAVEVLEFIGTPAARRVLEKLAGGATEALLTREAKAALKRLAGS